MFSMCRFARAEENSVAGASFPTGAGGPSDRRLHHPAATSSSNQNLCMETSLRLFGPGHRYSFSAR
jgi:hypothetical protein